MIEYLIRLTGVNIFDKNILKEHTKLVKKFDHNLKTEALNGLLENNFKIRKGDLYGWPIN